MSTPHKALPEQGGVSDRVVRDARDAATVLTPPPRENSSPNLVPIPGSPLLIVTNASAADAPTLLDAGPYRPASPPPDPHSSESVLAPGTGLGHRYEVVAVLGEVGMGAAYKATACAA